MKPYDASAIGSDIARSPTQALARGWAGLVVGALGLNRPGFIATEIVQQIRPLCVIPTREGSIRCVGGHGRLRWRARTFYTEEPETIKWLDALPAEAVLWDIGANVGLYAIYAAKLARCTVMAFEPEAQNYALLVENIALNGVGDRCFPACLAVSDRLAMGRLRVRYLTKGGAYNWFVSGDGLTDQEGTRVPESIAAAWGAERRGAVEQVVCGASIDELVETFGLPAPTHLKIDVDSLEPEIIGGASRLLHRPTLKSLLVEINRKSAEDLQIPERLARHGFRLVSERSNWLSRSDRSREAEAPSTNMIFSRPADVEAHPTEPMRVER